MASSLRITLTRSRFGWPEKQRRTLVALGLRRINQCRVHPDNSAIRGMVNVVRHLVTVEEVASAEEPAAATEA